MSGKRKGKREQGEREPPPTRRLSSRWRNPSPTPFWEVGAEALYRPTRRISDPPRMKDAAPLHHSPSPSLSKGNVELQQDDEVAVSALSPAPRPLLNTVRSQPITDPSHSASPRAIGNTSPTPSSPVQQAAEVVVSLTLNDLELAEDGQPMSSKETRPQPCLDQSTSCKYKAEVSLNWKGYSKLPPNKVSHPIQLSLTL